MDLGPPSSYLALAAGTDVFSSDDQHVGEVTHVLYDQREDVFDGIILARGELRRHVFADADEVDAIFERGVVLRLAAAACEQLPEPSANPAVLGEDPADGPTSRLRRAWDRLSGNY